MCLCEFNYRGQRTYVCDMHSKTGVGHRVVAKPRYTVDKPPRVYEIAILHGCTSKNVLAWAKEAGLSIRTASSRVSISDWFALARYYHEEQARRSLAIAFDNYQNGYLSLTELIERLHYAAGQYKLEVKETA